MGVRNLLQQRLALLYLTPRQCSGRCTLTSHSLNGSKRNALIRSETYMLPFQTEKLKAWRMEMRRRRQSNTQAFVACAAGARVHIIEFFMLYILKWS